VIAAESIPEDDLKRYGIDPRERYWLARKNG
jgi:hypothetical protein